MNNLPKTILDSVTGKFDIVIGIPSYNNRSTIAFVAEMASAGIHKYFPDSSCILVNADGDSEDLTTDAFLQSKTDFEKVAFIYEGIPGKGSAIHSILELSEEVSAKAIVLVDSDLRSIKPWWLERFVKPVFSGTEYVTPFYTRDKYDGTITNQICYPLTTVLYGLKIRQPIGGDFAIGSRLRKILLQKKWPPNAYRFGVDIWMTTIAINETSRVIQAALGAKIHDVKDPGKQLSAMFGEVVSTLFKLMEDYEEIWKQRSKIEECEIYGQIPDVKPESIVVDVYNLRRKFEKGLQENLQEIEYYLPKNIIEYMIKYKEDIKIDDELWVDLTYAFILAAHETREYEKIAKLMLPFYFGRIEYFVRSTREITNERAEHMINEQIKYFLKKKETLVSRW